MENARVDETKKFGIDSVDEDIPFNHFEATC